MGKQQDLIIPLLFIYFWLGGKLQIIAFTLAVKH